MGKVLQKAKSAKAPSGVKSSGELKFKGPSYGKGHTKMWTKGK